MGALVKTTQAPPGFWMCLDVSELLRHQDRMAQEMVVNKTLYERRMLTKMYLDISYAVVCKILHGARG